MNAENWIAKYEELKKNAWNGIWAKRILSELAFLIQYSESLEGKYDSLLKEKTEKLYSYVKENGAVTREAALSLEDELSGLAKEVKEYQVILAAHAHIDMNWMWGFQETASVTVDTFETILQLMEEYPQFTFSQSQASVYRILEEYYPELLQKVKKRVQEGRWEITASTWVENDKNMSGSEAMARHILYTKKYLSKLMDVPEDSLAIDFEPDTFGHNENMPEILTSGGVKYYYHCRGYDGEYIYRWQAPSGAEVIVYREPLWYNGAAEYDALTYVPVICKQYGLHTALKMYGVGDHGGGPTRRDISRWMEMQTWPLLPTIRFGTLREFFGELEKVRGQLPLVKQELNYIFTGCYTTQTRIKRANKIGEDRLYDAEALGVMAAAVIPDYKPACDLEEAWRKILFNQFHDILPGSGMVETREFAMGEFQRALAAAQIEMNHAMRSIGKAIDTSALADANEPGEDRALGAGVGFGTEDKEGFMTSRSSRAGGRRRIITIFNPANVRRKEIVKFQLWDWPGNPALICAQNDSGNGVGCEIVREGTHYWGHHYHDVLLEADVPAMGYATYVLDERVRDDSGFSFYQLAYTPDEAPRVDRFTDMPLTLENEKVKAVFSPDTMKLLSFVDKKNGMEMIKEPSCYFRLVTENTEQGMTAWRVGTWMKVTDLNECGDVRLLSCKNHGLVQSIRYRLSVTGASSLEATVALDQDSDTLRFEVHVDWHELGNVHKGIPQLNFAVPLGYEVGSYLCDIPFGVIERQPLAQDVPCTGFMYALPAEPKASGVVAMADCKYGFRGYENELGITLIRNSYDPDPTPEQGDHYMKLGVGISSADAEVLAKRFECFVHPLYTCTPSAHDGYLPCGQSLFTLNGGVRVTAWKKSENGNGIIIRFHNLHHEEKDVILETCKEIADAAFTDILEREIPGGIQAEGKRLSFRAQAGAVGTIRIGWKE